MSITGRNFKKFEYHYFQGGEISQLDCCGKIDRKNGHHNKNKFTISLEFSENVISYFASELLKNVETLDKNSFPQLKRTIRNIFEEAISIINLHKM